MVQEVDVAFNRVLWCVVEYNSVISKLVNVSSLPSTHDAHVDEDVHGNRILSIIRHLLAAQRMQVFWLTLWL